MNDQTTTTTWTIIPEPRTMRLMDGTLLLPMLGRINESRDIGDDRTILAAQLVDDIRETTGLDWDVATGDRWPGAISLTIGGDAADGTRRPGAYTLDVTPDGVTVAGADFEGVRNGVQTLRQLIRQCGAALPCLRIEDEPAFETRGYYLDVTRGRVPTLDWLKTWADKLCLYRYNQLQLYVEHTFAFDGMSETWRGSSPLTPKDILEFDGYCAERGIELVPSVSTFGHLYMALRTQGLRDLGEFPEDADEPFGFIDRMRHHTLNISDDRAFDLSCRLIDDYLQLFRSDKFNICADETFDLGKGRSKPLAERIGVAAMYADYVTRLCRHLETQGKQPMMWGDIALEHPEILERLPETVTLLNWQYDPQVDDGKIRAVAESGATQIVCPAVWCWNALLPRLDDAWNNIVRMARYGEQYHAQGMLVTDWGDFGHVNDPRMAIPGMIVGAQEAWAPGRVADKGEMLRRISHVEYHDAGGALPDILDGAGHAAAFAWGHLIAWLELDDGHGGVAADVLQAIPGLLSQDERPDVETLALRDDGPTPSPAAARRMLMRCLTRRLASTDAADRTLRDLARRIAATAASAGPRLAGDAAAFRIAIEGQRLLNRIGLHLAAEAGTLDGPWADAAARRDDATRLAGELEVWMEAYAAQWRTVSRESELRRLQDVVYAIAGHLRSTGGAPVTPPTRG
ncbi:family 20 glycosylhydrolase [Bifidobacterium sp. CP2]|uniref:glycoside hydrolase family 20 zincin-like fold domain-containing protein n=1 Tax=Bifidobacterium sp. CP2 TaxID=2809025 RepID=UPI001BDC2421|nr:glycoside hydrolase family 20 zincin-like fold domain-containing protein [Bifidobacterium sp. CP2]MBT1181593.1 family 20 glycosylhydrolase [Bifidobacterium sp. CP2]